MTKTSNKNTPESHGNGGRIDERTRKGENIRLRHKNGLETKIGGIEQLEKSKGKLEELETEYAKLEKKMKTAPSEDVKLKLGELSKEISQVNYRIDGLEAQVISGSNKEAEQFERDLGLMYKPLSPGDSSLSGKLYDNMATNEKFEADIQAAEKYDFSVFYLYIFLGGVSFWRDKACGASGAWR